MYWKIIVQEVLNRGNHNYRFMYTMNGGSFSRNRECNDGANQDGGGASNDDNGHRRQKDNKRFSLGDKFPDVIFTRREAECMMEFLNGKTILAVAKTLSISHRTVEFYLKKMKNKLDCKTKSELISKILISDLMENYKIELAKIQDENL